VRIWKLFLGLAALLAAACSDDGSTALGPEGATVAGRLDFLKTKSVARAYVTDSAYDPIMDGFGVLDPPYESGPNQLTVLTDLDQPELTVEQTLPLGGEGVIVAVELSPDGDTALVARRDPHALLVVRGLSTGTPYLAQTVPVGFESQSMAFSPDGSWALAGTSSFGPPLRLYVIRGLPAAAEVDDEIDLGPDETIDCGYVNRVRITDDGRHALALTTWGRIHTGIPDEATLRIIADPQPGGAKITTSILHLPLTPALPVPEEFEGLSVGLPASFEVLCDTDSLILPMRGFIQGGAADARILLVHGIHGESLEIARILGPDDGVPITPHRPIRLPDCDRVVLTTMWAEKICLVSGLSDPTFESVAIESFDAPRAGLAPALTADGHTLLVLKPRGPFDNRPPALIHTFDIGSAVTQIGGPFYGPVRAPPYLDSSLIATPPPGMSDYVALFTRTLPPDVNESLQAKIDVAVAQADRGQDMAAMETLHDFLDEVTVLAQDGSLRPAEVKILDTLVDVAEARLR